MTSVLYAGGLNYQTGNPIRTEFGKVNNSVSELRKLVESQGSDIKLLKQRIDSLEKENTSLKDSITQAVETARKATTSNSTS
jgi:molybdopterin converting factor small subunit